MMEIVGWTGAILFAFCAVPQAVQSYSQKNSNGVSSTFIWMWMIGEILTLIYVIPTLQYPLIFNYVFNILCLFVITYFKYFPKNLSEHTTEGLTCLDLTHDPLITQDELDEFLISRRSKTKRIQEYCLIQQYAVDRMTNEELDLWYELLQKVHQILDMDKSRTQKWWTTRNPIFGDFSPNFMIIMDKIDSVEKFVNEAYDDYLKQR